MVEKTENTYLKFKCPKCGGTQITTREKVWMFHRVKIALDGEMEFDTENPKKGHGVLTDVGCSNCDWDFPVHTEYIADWLRDNCKQE